MKIVVIGGGIAGVCCVEEVCRLGQKADEITLVSASSVLKGVTNVVKRTANLEEFDVVERDLTSLPYKNLTVVNDVVSGIDGSEKTVELGSGTILHFDKLCICTGARPKDFNAMKHVLTLRDVESIERLRARLEGARKVMVVGNGGIALEVMQALKGVEIIWALKHPQIGDAFFDVDAAQFLLEELEMNFWQKQPQSTQETDTSEKEVPTSATGNAARTPGTEKKDSSSNVRQEIGHAVGPRWAEALPESGEPPSVTLEPNSVVEYVGEAATLDPGSYPISVRLSNGNSHEVDFVISAIGVDVVMDWVPEAVERASDGGLKVDSKMETSVEGVFAAGDCCSFTSHSPHWFQMRLWTQARIMGTYAAHCMLGVADDYASGFNFELFTHATKFCGKKVILLGLYNGQGLEGEPKEDLISYSRVVKAPVSSFVRVVLLRGRMQGAVLIGDTEMEEAFENVILDGIDLSSFGEEILDPELEFDHIFD
ncbi:hypothetical protein BSKO_01578 [Bryopsis sp. KO-2023]|nr:hypothetical protein BSKO_01578 [Bryopsis sp. KO-2023]